MFVRHRFAFSVSHFLLWTFSLKKADEFLFGVLTSAWSVQSMIFMLWKGLLSLYASRKVTELQTECVKSVKPLQADFADASGECWCQCFSNIYFIWISLCLFITSPKHILNIDYCSLLHFLYIPKLVKSVFFYALWIWDQSKRWSEKDKRVHVSPHKHWDFLSHLAVDFTLTCSSVSSCW